MKCMTQKSKNEIYYQASRDTIQYQNTVHQDFTGRAMNLIGFAVAMLAAGAIALNLPEDGVPLNEGMWTALTLWGGGFAGLILSCGYVLFPKRWEVGPTIDSLGDTIAKDDHNSEEVLWFLADSFKTSFLHNTGVLEKKARAINLAMMALAMEATGLIFAGVLLFAAAGMDPSSAGECTGPMG